MSEPLLLPNGRVLRYTFRERLMHWLAGFSYLYLLLSGLAFWSPWLFWLAVILGGPTIARELHPWFGVIFMIAVIWMFGVWGSQMRFTDARPGVVRARSGITSATRTTRSPTRTGSTPARRRSSGVSWSAGSCCFLTGLVLWEPHWIPWSLRFLRLIAVIVHPIAALLTIAPVHDPRLHGHGGRARRLLVDHPRRRVPHLGGEVPSRSGTSGWSGIPRPRNDRSRRQVGAAHPAGGGARREVPLRRRGAALLRARRRLPASRSTRALAAASGAAKRVRPPGSLRDELELFLLLPWFAPFLAFIEEIAPPPLAQAAAELSAAGRSAGRRCSTSSGGGETGGDAPRDRGADRLGLPATLRRASRRSHRAAGDPRHAAALPALRRACRRSASCGRRGTAASAR